MFYTYWRLILIGNVQKLYIGVQAMITLMELVAIMVEVVVCVFTGIIH
jgi:hypothetical protein